MNIFALDPSPQQSAKMHCDQHLHKMILESAQLLSTMAYHAYPALRPYIYKPTHSNHPCTLWICADTRNAAWLINLALSLDDIRQDLNHKPHASIEPILKIRDYIPPHDFNRPVSHIFCGPPTIAIRRDLTVHQKYQMYYIRKRQEWLDSGRKMTYHHRPIPEFLIKELA